MVHADVSHGDTIDKSEELSILFVGRLDAHKGVIALLEATAEVRSRGVDAQCVVIGERERWYEWPEAIQSLVDELEAQIDFRGFVSDDDLAQAYRDADVLVLPSEYETFGQVIVEALHSGTPVVSTPVGIAPELIRDGKNGVVYDPSNSSNLADALMQIYQSNPNLLRDAAINSVSDLTWDNLIDELEVLYE
jgi:glycosyltransferase involved in cell wall biosynthesis